MFNNELSKQICKIGGPFILLVCCPTLAYICYNLTEDGIRKGEVITVKWIAEIIVYNLIFFAGGLYFTYKGYEDKFKK